jgi:glycosyltransferase involved in cell wall biosynthesis
MFSILVVVPTLNSYHLLSNLVRSLEVQTFTNWRVLFIDGKSSVPHREWLREQCSKDSRFHWEEETYSGRGIFAAMNQGFKHALEKDWLLFWGSDDMAASKDAFKKVEEAFMLTDTQPDLYIFSGRYYSCKYLLEGKHNLKKTRFSRFILRKTFRNSLFWGSTPPHQATLFGPSARRLVQQYDETYKLTGDLNYFLSLSTIRNIRVYVDDLVVVLMGDSGVSGRQGLHRLREVIRSYRSSFGNLWIFPFVMRYIQRSWSNLWRR